jgi:biopolymer transport protein ExbD
VCQRGEDGVYIDEGFGAHRHARLIRRWRRAMEYTPDKRLSVNKQDVAMADLEQRLRTIYEERRDKTMYIMAAGALRHGDVVEVIDAAKGAGVQRVGIVTERMRHQ